jgi:hypothetical protein
LGAREEEMKANGAQSPGDIIHGVINSSGHWRMRAEEMRTIAEEIHDPIPRVHEGGHLPNPEARPATPTGTKRSQR